MQHHQSTRRGPGEIFRFCFCFLFRGPGPSRRAGGGGTLREIKNAPPGQFAYPRQPTCPRNTHHTKPVNHVVNQIYIVYMCDRVAVGVSCMCIGVTERRVFRGSKNQKWQQAASAVAKWSYQYYGGRRAPWSLDTIGARRDVERRERHSGDLAQFVGESKAYNSY